MRIVDTNILLYAVNTAAEQHRDAHTWLSKALGGADRVGFAWVSLLGFLRIGTNPRAMTRPLTTQAATGQVRHWLDAPGAVVIQPTARHHDILSDLVAARSLLGNTITDAHLAALAVEHSASVVTYDSDFDRFRGVEWHTPAELLQS